MLATRLGRAEATKFTRTLQGKRNINRSLVVRDNQNAIQQGRMAFFVSKITAL